MNSLPRELIIKEILTKAPQLGIACKEFYEFLPKITPEQRFNVRFPSSRNKNPVQINNGNLSFEYEAIIDFSKLNALIEDHNVQTLNISTQHTIFIEIKRMFEIILNNPVSIMDGWIYKSTFMYVNNTHYDKCNHRKAYFTQMEWMDSFVTSFIFNLYH